MPMFTNATSSAGIRYTGETWSVVWTDINGDHSPDLWISKHNPFSQIPNAEGVSLYLNNGYGVFQNVTSSTVDYLQKDFHGAVAADFDNDGDADIAQLGGGSTKGGVTFYENTGGSLHDLSAAHALDLYSNAPGRNGLALDYNNDGLLDFYLGAEQTSTGGSGGTGPILLRQEASGTFVNAGSEVGFNVTNSISPFLSDLTGDGRPELILTHYGAITRIFDTSGPTFKTITSKLLGGVSIPKFDDMVIADFNNDGHPDIYLTRSGVVDEVATVGNQVRAFVTTPAVGELKGFSFSSAGPETFTFSKRDVSIDYSQIHVGLDGHNPITSYSNPSFTLSPTDPQNFGILAHTANDTGLYIGYDQPSATWVFTVAGNARVARGFSIDSTSAIDNLQVQGFPLHPTPLPDQLLLNTGSGFVDASGPSGIAAMQIFGSHLAVGDFNNDGAPDIYVDQASAALNRPNIVLLNQGDASFVKVTATGASGSGQGQGGSVAVADYDHDGFLDLVATNGGGEPPFNALNFGPVQLFHNTGNGNSWLEVRLHGVVSTADAIGAKVFAISGGIQQLREEVGGQHFKAQDDRDLHFGFGQQTTVDMLRIEWPRSAPTILHNVPVNQILDVYEGQQSSNLDPHDLPGSLATPDDGHALALLDAPQAGGDVGFALDFLGLQPTEGDAVDAGLAMLVDWSSESIDAQGLAFDWAADDGLATVAGAAFDSGVEFAGASGDTDLGSAGEWLLT